jgi:hypothetical protein
MVSKMDLDELALQGRIFISDYRLYEMRRGQLQINLHGDIWEPKINSYWQKECGEFDIDCSGGLYSYEMGNDRFDLLDLTQWSEIERDYVWNFGVAEEVEFEGKLMKTGRYIPVEARRECLLYIGPYCPLFSTEEIFRQEKRYKESLKRLENTDFENLLVTGDEKPDGYDGRSLRRVITILNNKGIGVSQRQSGIAAESILLRLAVLRLIAGAVQVYCDSLRWPDGAVEAGVAKQLNPSQKATKLAEKLLNEIRTIGAEISWIDYLQRLADGKSFYPVIPPDMRVRACIREISFLSRELFDINNNKASRFPTSAIHRILDIVGVSVSESTIVNHQRLYDESTPGTLGSLSGDISRQGIGVDIPF